LTGSRDNQFFIVDGKPGPEAIISLTIIREKFSSLKPGCRVKDVYSTGSYPLFCMEMGTHRDDIPFYGDREPKVVIGRTIIGE